MNFDRDGRPTPEFLNSDDFYDDSGALGADDGAFETLGVAEGWEPCRVCGCTHGASCVDELGVCCSRSEPDLCTFCANGRRAVGRVRLGTIAAEPPAADEEAA